MRVLLALAAALLALVASAAAQAQTREEVDFVLRLFERLQPLSFGKEREHCGFIGRDADGRLVATDPMPGLYASCTSPWPSGLRVLASYHTHGSFDAGYHNELPSEVDMLSDQALGVDGWIATPGGRLWFVESDRMVTKQICGVGCLPVAPGFTKSHSGVIAKGYTFDELAARLAK